MSVPAEEQTDASVPGSEQSAETGDNKSISDAQWRSLEGAGIDPEASGYVREQPTEQPEADAADSTPETELTDEAEDVEVSTPEEPEETTDDETAEVETPTEPEEETEETQPSEPEIDLTAYGIQRGEDGTLQVPVKVDGAEELFNLDRVVNGFNLSEHNDRVARELAEERKAIERDRQELDDLRRALFLPENTAPAAKPAEDEDVYDVGSYSEEQPGIPPALAAKLQSLEQEVSTLKADKVAAEESAREQEQAKQTADHLQWCFGIVDQALEVEGLPGVSDDEKARAIKVAAENAGVSPLSIASEPRKVAEVVKSRYKKTVKPKAPVDGSKVPSPPTTESTKRASKGPGKVKQTQQKLEKARQEARDTQVDPGEAAFNLIRANREHEQAKNAKG